MDKFLKLAVFDFDSTLVDGETIEYLAKINGCESDVIEITKKAMEGELDFFESLTKRVKLLKGLDVNKVNEVCKNMPIMSGAKETIATLKTLGYKTICFSGGFRNATIPICNELGINIEFSNILHEKNGFLTGEVGGEMMFSSSKGDMLQKIQKFLNISFENTVVVGDGANDLSMFPFAKNKVAFVAKNKLKEQANIIIDKKDLTLILNHLQ